MSYETSSLPMTAGIFVRVAGMCALLLAVVCPTARAGLLSGPEYDALTAIFTATDGKSWFNSNHWGDADACTYYGVVCDQDTSPGTNDSHVTGIALSANNLSGTFPTVTSTNFPYLVLLEIPFNTLKEPFPVDATSTLMQVIDISSNSYSGSLPPLATFTNLHYFDVAQNQFSGEIPSLSMLTKLQTFSVAANQFTGSIPELDGLPDLTELRFQNNQLTGTLPALAGLQNLTHAVFSSNQLSGAIPPLTGLTSLIYLDLSSNQLSDAIPSFADLGSITFMNLSSNALTGPIPSLSGLVLLTSLNVSHNQLGGPLPCLSTAEPCKSGLAALSALDASHNLITGAIPPLDGLVSLSTLHLENNLLADAVPAFVGVNALQDLDLSSNLLTALPCLSTEAPCGSALTGIFYFNVEDNLLAGEIPYLGSLGTLVSLRLAHNQLTGPVPAVPIHAGKGSLSATLCPNLLDSTPSGNDDGWNAATGFTPWWYSSGGKACDNVFFNSFE